MSTQATMHASMQDALVVPLALQAAMVGQGDIGETRLAGPYASFSRLTPQQYRSANVSFLGTRMASESDLGVHLHWPLPPPFTTGYAGPDPAASGAEPKKDDLSFLTAPDRWLVVRLAKEGGPLPSAAWVVESSFCAFEGQWDGVTAPCEPTRFTGHAYVGRAVPLHEWLDRGETQSVERELGWKLTAVGWGDGAFAAYYPSCRNVFGFHDRLLDAQEKPFTGKAELSYLVVGWHSRAADDLLTSKKPLREPLPWMIPDDGDGAKLRSLSRTLFRGLLPPIRWDGTAAGFACGKTQSVTLGNHVQESLATLVAHDAGRLAPSGATEAPLSQRLANGLLAELDQSGSVVDNGAAHVDAELHRLRFLPENSGNLWLVRPREKVVATGSNRPEEPPAVPPQLVALVARLNAAQHALDYGAREWEARRRHIRDDISLLEQMIANPKACVDDMSLWSPIRGQLRDRLEEEMAAIARMDRRALRDEAAAAKLDLDGILATDPRFELIRIPAPRFWRPRDLSLLFQDDDLRGGEYYGTGFSYTGMPPAQSYAEPESTKLRCRRLQEIVAGGSRAEFARTLAFGNLPDPQACELLVSEALALVTKTSSASLGKQWRPMYARWLVRFFPETPVPATAGQIPQSVLSARWKFPQADTRQTQRTSHDLSELAPVRTPERLADGVWFSGVSAVNMELPQMLRGRLERRLQTAQTLSEKVSTLPAEAAAGALASCLLDGLHDQMLMRKQAVTLPFQGREDLLQLYDLPPWLEGARSGDSMEPDIKATQFLPFRGGYLAIEKLELIDTFGRVKTVEIGETTVLMAPGLQPSNTLPRTGVTAVLPPRFTVPSRLSFRFRSAVSGADALNYAASTTPVCGWVIPSYLEQGAIFCAADGTMIGIVRLVDGTPDFLAAPDRTLADLHPHLRTIAGNLLDKTVPLHHFLESIGRQIGSIVQEPASRSSGISRVMGKPLAVVTAEMGIDLMGDLPPRAHVLPLDGGAGDRGLLGVDIPVLLGDPWRSSDGLAAFFAAPPGGEVDFSRLYTPDGPAVHGEVAAEDRYPKLRIAGHGRGHRMPLVLLMDPHAPVHAGTGLFPVKAITLPAAHYKAASTNLGLLFPCGPVLLPQASGWTLPLPTVEGHDWHWQGPGSGNQWMPLNPTPPLEVTTELPTAVMLKTHLWLTLRPALKNSTVERKETL